MASLDGALKIASQLFESDVKLRATIKSAMTYPVAVLMMAFVAVVAMLIFIVPVFQAMFTSLGGELPLPTQILVTLSLSTIMRYLPCRSCHRASSCGARTST